MFTCLCFVVAFVCVCIFLGGFLGFFYPLGAWKCFIFHPKFRPFSLEGMAEPYTAPAELHSETSSVRGCACTGALGWKVYFCCHHQPCVHFFLLGQLGPAKARGLFLSASEHMGMAAAQGCFTFLGKQRGKKEFLLESHRFPSFDILPACREGVREVQNTDAGPFLLWLER